MKTINKGAKIKKGIVGSLNLSHLKKAQQDKIVSGFMEIVAARVNMEIWKRLADSDKKELKKILTKPNSKKFPDFLVSRVENLPKIVENAARKTADEFRTIRSR